MRQIDLDPTHQKWGIALGILLVALATLDLVGVKGESVGGGATRNRQRLRGDIHLRLSADPAAWEARASHPPH